MSQRLNDILKSLRKKKLLLIKSKAHRRCTLKKYSFLLFILLSSFFVGTAQSSQKIKIGWVFAMANAPVVIAEAKGYYKEVGLDAEIISFTNGPIVHQALAAGQLDMAYSRNWMDGFHGRRNRQCASGFIGYRADWRFILGI